MPLTVDTMNKILKEEILEMEPSIKGPEEDEFRTKVRGQIKEIEAAGGIVDIPAEWEVGE